MTNGTGKGTAFISLPLMLSACGGDGGGAVPSFTSWSTVQPNSTVVAQALSQEATYRFDPDTGQVVSVGIASPVSGNSSATMTFGTDGSLSQLILRTPTRTVDFDVFANLGGGFLSASNTNTSSVAIIADPVILGYEYQNFGIWETDVTSIETAAGTFSAGAPTAGSNIPTTSTATFTGDLAGLYVDPAGIGFFAFGVVNVDADFAGRTLAFSTTSTVIITRDLTTETLRPDLNLAGTLTYAPGTNSFTGTVDSAGSLISSRLSGSSTGQFYGPSAQELGGVFFLEDKNDLNSVETYSGAYGASR